MAGLILPAIDGLRWLITSVTSKRTYNHTQLGEKVYEERIESLSKPFLESSIDKLFQKVKRDSCFNTQRLAQKKYAHACADWLCEQTTSESVHDEQIELYTSGETSIVKATVKDCKLKLKETINDGIQSTITVNVDTLENIGKDQRIVALLRDRSSTEFSYVTELLQTWLKFSEIIQPEAMRNVRLVLHGECGDRIKIKCKIVKKNISVVFNDKHQGEVVFEVDEINKRTLGRLIILICGNEGTTESTQQAALRRLIQACISSLEKRNHPSWCNTKLSLYGQNDMSFHVIAGESCDTNHVIGYLESNGQFQIVERDNSSCLIS